MPSRQRYELWGREMRRKRQMGGTETGLLRRLARVKGIETSYVNTSGKVCEVSDKTLQAILELRGITPSNATAIRACLERERVRELNRFVEPVVVAWGGDLGKVGPFFGKGRQNQRLHVRLRLESGEEARVES